MKKSQLKQLIKEIIREKPSYGDQISLAWKKAAKEKNIEAMAYYELLGDTSASVSFETFKGSWAYEKWIKHPKVIAKMKDIAAEHKRFSYLNEESIHKDFGAK